VDDGRAVSRSLSVVVATFEWPRALDVVLHALAEQRDRDFSVVVADDGSGEETAQAVERWRGELELSHVWQENEGFLKARLLNRAALAADGEYLLFLDGDCVPRRGLTASVRRAVLPGWFVGSKRLHLSPETTERALSGQWPIWRWSAAEWVVRAPKELTRWHYREQNRPGVLIPVRDRARPWNGGLDFQVPYSGYGYVFGVSREDFWRVNGFDMRFCGWDGEDLDIAERLRAAGLRCGWPGPGASVLHLWHEFRKRPASPPERALVAAPEGLRELQLELAAQESANRVGASSPSSDPVKR